MSDLVKRPFVPLSVPPNPSLHVGIDSPPLPLPQIETDTMRLGEYGRIFTRSEAADALRISEHQLYHLRRDGKIRSFKIGSAVYLTEADLVDFVGRRLADSEAGASRPKSEAAS